MLLRASTTRIEATVLAPSMPSSWRSSSMCVATAVDSRSDPASATAPTSATANDGSSSSYEPVVPGARSVGAQDAGEDVGVRLVLLVHEADHLIVDARLERCGVQVTGRQLEGLGEPEQLEVVGRRLIRRFRRLRLLGRGGGAR